MSELRIIGNETVRKLLDATISGGRISHAQLFSAPEGVGALRIAIDYALKALGAGEEKMFSHPDLHYVFPVNTNKDVKKSPVERRFSASVAKIRHGTPLRQPCRLVCHDGYREQTGHNRQGRSRVDSEKTIAQILFGGIQGGGNMARGKDEPDGGQQAAKTDRGTRRTYIDNNRHGRRRSRYSLPYHHDARRWNSAISDRMRYTTASSVSTEPHQTRPGA